MKIGFYYGSFDPFTNGHLNLVSESIKRCDKVIVTIGINPLKMYRKRRFDRNSMEKAMKKIFKRKKFKNIEIQSGFFITIWKIRKVKPILIRGIRNKKDYIYEKRLANIWKKIFGLDTIFIKGNKISSTMVMNKLEKGEDVKEFLPKEILEIIRTK